MLTTIKTKDPQSDWAKLINRLVIHKSSLEKRNAELYQKHSDSLVVIGGISIISGNLDASYTPWGAYSTLPSFPFFGLAEYHRSKANKHQSAVLAKKREAKARDIARSRGYPWADEKINFSAFELMSCNFPPI